MTKSTSAERTGRTSRRDYRGPAVLALGLRPFFLLAGLWAAVSLPLWLALLIAGQTLPSRFGPFVWHGHEMLFGYTIAVIVGFLLTAIPNWTGRLPVAGWRLMLLFLLWCVARVAFLVMAPVGPLPAVVIDSLFLPCLLLAMAREIVVGRNWRNLTPLALVGLLAAANIGFHAEVLIAGGPDISMRVAAAALIGLIMLIGGRIVPSFTHSLLSQIGSERRPVSFDRFDVVTLLVSGMALLLWVVRPASDVTGAFFLIAAIVQCVRLWRWAGVHTWREPLVFVLHLGYAFIPLGFLVGATSIPVPGSIAGTAALYQRHLILTDMSPFSHSD